MKSLLLVLMATCCLTAEFFAQQETVAKFVVMNATSNNVDISRTAIDQGQHLVFYRVEGDDRMFLANFWPKNDSQSWGPIFSFESKRSEETIDQYAWDEFSFRWNYSNSYDNKEGTAFCQLTKIYKPQGVYFEFKIIPENLDVLIYKGYMEGSLDFSNFR